MGRTGRYNIGKRAIGSFCYVIYAIEKKGEKMRLCIVVAPCRA